MTRATLFGLIGWLTLTLASPLIAQPFTYQGFLKQNGQPVNGTVSMVFRLYDAPTGGNQIGGSIPHAVSVQNGLFTVALDFGNVWTGADRYLEISVGSTTLAPRVKITPAPYAAFAASAGFAQRPWQSAGSNIFYNDGNVGIGTSSPAARLSLGGGDANTKLAIWQGNTASQVMGLGVGPAQFRLHLNNSNDRFSFLNAPNGSEVMTIGGNGFVGIGNNNPLTRLHISDGHLRVDGGQIQTNSWLELRPDYDNTGDGLVRFLDGAGNETMRIHFNGNVGINTGNPWYRLHVGGDGYFTQRLMVGRDSSAGQLHVTTSSPYGIYAVNERADANSRRLGTIGRRV